MKWNERVGNSIQCASNSMSDWVSEHGVILWIISSVLIVVGGLFFLRLDGVGEIVGLIFLGAIAPWFLCGLLYLLLGVIDMFGYAIMHPLTALSQIVIFALVFGAIFGVFWLVMELFSGDTFDEKHYEALEKLRDEMSQERKEINETAQKIYDIADKFSEEEEDAYAEIGTLANEIIDMTSDDSFQLDEIMEEYSEHELNNYD